MAHRDVAVLSRSSAASLPRGDNDRCRIDAGTVAATTRACIPALNRRYLSGAENGGRGGRVRVMAATIIMPVRPGRGARWRTRPSRPLKTSLNSAEDGRGIVTVTQARGKPCPTGNRPGECRRAGSWVAGWVMVQGGDRRPAPHPRSPHVARGLETRRAMPRGDAQPVARAPGPGKGDRSRRSRAVGDRAGQPDRRCFGGGSPGPSGALLTA